MEGELNICFCAAWCADNLLSVVCGCVVLQETDVRMHEVMRLAHEFLQCFCLGNPINQNLLHQNLSMFLTTGVCTSGRRHGHPTCLETWNCQGEGGMSGKLMMFRKVHKLGLIHATWAKQLGRWADAFASHYGHFIECEFIIMSFLSVKSGLRLQNSGTHVICHITFDATWWWLAVNSLHLLLLPLSGKLGGRVGQFCSVWRALILHRCHWNTCYHWRLFYHFIALYISGCIYMSILTASRCISLFAYPVAFCDCKT